MPFMRAISASKESSNIRSRLVCLGRLREGCRDRGWLRKRFFGFSRAHVRHSRRKVSGCAGEIPCWRVHGRMVQKGIAVNLSCCAGRLAVAFSVSAVARDRVRPSGLASSPWRHVVNRLRFGPPRACLAAGLLGLCFALVTRPRA